MPRLGESQKRTVLALLFAWPVVVAIGLLVGRVTATPWPVPAAAVGWLATLFFCLRRAAGQRN